MILSQTSSSFGGGGFKPILPKAELWGRAIIPHEDETDRTARSVEL